VHAPREDCQTDATLCCTERGGIVKQFRLAQPETVSEEYRKMAP